MKIHIRPDRFHTDLKVWLLTHSTDQSSSWEGSNDWSGQEPRSFTERGCSVPYSTETDGGLYPKPEESLKSPHTNPLKSASRSPILSVPAFRFIEYILHAFLIACKHDTWYMSLPSQLFSVNHSNDILWEVQGTKRLIMQLFPCSCILLPPTSK